MVDRQVIEEQLKKINFKVSGWGRGEVNELEHIILPDEEIYEAANGIYEAGFALLLATDIRVILVDKKPLNFLTVEDLRFDMINEIDYNHRVIGSSIIITTGNKTLNFRSYNKERLRRLIGHVQRCMAEAKKKQTSTVEDQSNHLERINKQLQSYLMAQYRQQQDFNKQLSNFQSGTRQTPPDFPEPIKPDPELSDYLYSRGLIDRYQRDTGQELTILPAQMAANNQVAEPADPQAYYWSQPQVAQQQPPASHMPDSQLAEIYESGVQEVFGKRGPRGGQPKSNGGQGSPTSQGGAIEAHPIKIAISKLPLALRSRKFSFGLHRPSWPSLPTHQSTHEAQEGPEAEPYSSYS